MGYLIKRVMIVRLIDWWICRMDYWNAWWLLDWLIDEFVEWITEMRDDC